MRRLIAALLVCLLDIPVHAEDCVASVYAVGDLSQPGTKTASGIPLNDDAMTAAHKSLPFGSKVEVTNTKNGRAVTVTITDRGHMLKGAALICPGPVHAPLNLPGWLLWPSRLWRVTRVRTH